MNFYTKKRRMPQVIIVSLIDIFAILLIFVIVTTTFKGKQGGLFVEPALVPASKSDDYLYFRNDEIFLKGKKATGDELKAELRKLVNTNNTSKLGSGLPFEGCSVGFMNQVNFIFNEVGLKDITLYSGVESK